MLMCIPTNGDAGLKDTVCDHFGSAPFFTLYDTKTEELSIIENRNSHHSHGTCHPMNQLSKYQIDSVVCNGMGRRAIEALNYENIKVYQSDASEVDEVINQLKENKLSEMDPLTSCHGQGQRIDIHEHDSDRGSGYGRGRGTGQGRGAGIGRGGRRGQGQGSGRGRNRSMN